MKDLNLFWLLFLAASHDLDLPILHMLINLEDYFFIFYPYTYLHHHLPIIHCFFINNFASKGRFMPFTLILIKSQFHRFHFIFFNHLPNFNQFIDNLKFMLR